MNLLLMSTEPMSKLDRVTAVAALFALGVVTAGCFANQSRALRLDSGTLLDEARAACQRHDQHAVRMLTERLQQRYPNTSEARHAGRLADSAHRCAPTSSPQRNNVAEGARDSTKDPSFRDQPARLSTAAANAELGNLSASGSSSNEGIEQEPAAETSQ